jgi:hypothetical protein
MKSGNAPHPYAIEPRRVNFATRSVFPPWVMRPVGRRRSSQAKAVIPSGRCKAFANLHLSESIFVRRITDAVNRRYWSILVEWHLHTNHNLARSTNYSLVQDRNWSVGSKSVENPVTRYPSGCGIYQRNYRRNESNARNAAGLTLKDTHKDIPLHTTPYGNSLEYSYTVTYLCIVLINIIESVTKAGNHTCNVINHGYTP